MKRVWSGGSCAVVEFIGPLGVERSRLALDLCCAGVAAEVAAGVAARPPPKT
ncbi:MAG: hypothetical protein ACI9MC_003766 [Kiritimatiellia bacterium]|jgi:hypothetical protein